jgi:hypothetical protein
MKRKKGLRGIASKSTARKTQKGTRPAKIFIYALALAALSGGGYLLYDHLRRKKFANSTSIISSDTANTIPGAEDAYASNTTVSSPSGKKAKATLRVKSNDDFPLKKGSRGARVTQLQQALIKHGAAIKADGIFGPATLAALKAAGYSSTVDATIFTKITGVDSSALRLVFNPSELAKKMFSAANGKNEQIVLSVLQQIKTVSDYSAVNEYYKKQGFVSKTIVTHLLEYAFKDDEASAQLIKEEFKRIGLKVNEAGVWSLQGIQLYKDLITIRPTFVIDTWNNRIPVKGNTILGDEVKIENGMTWFRSVDRTMLKVPTQDIKYSSI